MIYSAVKGDIGDESIFDTTVMVDGAIALCIDSLELDGHSNLNVNVRVDEGEYRVVAFPVDGETGKPIGEKIQTFDG